ncbi:hypothetical protein E2C01_078206 [Portunus trituberculatus]|uniref:Uncharacterized protein n=1 Tax=Portunus trituberculatus TaxID=210409 RepID=A0A5B7ITI2_PORTR|nr:hypothetical protein [Portunus trituberculatus]
MGTCTKYAARDTSAGTVMTLTPRPTLNWTGLHCSSVAWQRRRTLPAGRGKKPHTGQTCGATLKNTHVRCDTPATPGPGGDEEHWSSRWRKDMVVGGGRKEERARE